MDEYPIYILPNHLVEKNFCEIPDKPKQLFSRGTFPDDEYIIFLTVVGARNFSPYGEEVCKKLIAGLQGYPIVIVSGLAQGIDSIAHHTAIDVGLTSIGFPGSGLDDKTLYPRSNVELAKKILHSGGCLLSEYPEETLGNSWTFPRRNRLMAGIAKATLLIEATNQSGSRITAKLATEYNRDVFAVPGSIFAENSQAPNELIKLGATPITSSQDLLEALGFSVTETAPLTLFSECSSDEALVLKLLSSPMRRGDLIRALNLPTYKANVIISQMEMKGLIKEMGGELRRV